MRADVYGGKREADSTYATECGTSRKRIQVVPPQQVANSVGLPATLCDMKQAKWQAYWKRVCAPKLKARKDEIGRVLPEREIAAAVESATGKPSERSLVSMWLLGEREPFISQFFALCEKLEMDPLKVLQETGAAVGPTVVRERRPVPEVRNIGLKDKRKIRR